MSTSPTRDLTRTTLAVLFIGMLIAACIWILRPFLLPLLWATMIVVATWPLMLGAQARLWGRRGLAVAVMTLALLLVFFVPFTLAIAAIVQNADEIIEWARSLGTATLGPPPEWLGKIPAVGRRLVEQWQELAVSGHEAVTARLAPYAGKFVAWFVAQAGSLGMLFVEFLMTVLLAALLYAGGERAADGVCRFARRLAGRRGEDAIILAGRAVRGVALGVVVTAMVQAVLGGVGLAVAGVPFVSVLTAVMFISSLIQVGPIPVLLPAVGWLYWSGHPFAGTLLLVWTVVAANLDNVLRPILIRKGVDLPMLLILAGSIGGLIAFGIIGLFIGPVLLAVSYTLLTAWIEGDVGQASE
ncbi:MAG TPA: AI-2E family transporter YdiK [Desulfuromonadales bacterium]|nr:AI-2E family transporter YdiK [Desulfuromonadales bacterium]